LHDLLNNKSANAFEEIFARVFSIVIETLDGRSDWPQTIVSEHGLNVFGVEDKNKVVSGLQPAELDDRPKLLVQLRVQLHEISKIVLP
jgi:hypothetical protein